MTTTSLNASPSTTQRPSISGVLAGAVLLLAAITVLIVLVLARTTGTTNDTTSGTNGGGQDTSQCHPTAVVHYC